MLPTQILIGANNAGTAAAWPQPDCRCAGKRKIMNFGERLFQLRTERGIYQKQLAEYLSVSIGTISNYENSVHYPDLETLCRFAEYFHVTTDYLLDLTDNAIPIDSLNIEMAGSYTVGTALNAILQLSGPSRRQLARYLNMIRACDQELPEKNRMINRQRQVMERQKQEIERQKQLISRQAGEISRLEQALGEKTEGK